MSARPDRLRRCQLSVPGSNARMMEKAAGLDVDHVFLDLEDAVAPAEKVAARGKVVHALNTLDWGRKTRCVRVNDITSPWVLDDVLAVFEGAGDNLDTLMLPKIRTAADMAFFDLLLTHLETRAGRTRRIGLEILIEEVEGMHNLDAIVVATDRLEAIVLGMVDYSASQNMDPLGAVGRSAYPGDLWHYARNRMIVAARANGLDMVDGPFSDIGNRETFEEECRRALALGCVGKWALHPDQVEVAQRCFSPDPAAVERSRRMQSAYDEALKAGVGAIRFEGEMVDVATVRTARRVTEAADRIARLGG
ncbi:CoA ester lyase [Phenylobacterium sp.]|uniref:HpcH/HpaI aldolase/citrate lyase family protein n=1 Tax=Phenylobacterium sp. TaxID=1871053 RepID=UPI0027344892|nr:CoA ester lyase [Phenylobacterium sp.]MDP3661066.1 CoA ester lyase [Phenylobacterium sp.]